MITYPNEDRVLSYIEKHGPMSVPMLTNLMYDYSQTTYVHTTGYEYTRTRIRQILISAERKGLVERKRFGKKDLWKVIT